MGAVSAVFFVMLTLTSGNVLADSASSVGLLIAFYYGITGFACAWFFRRELLAGAAGAAGQGHPAGRCGGLALLAAFVLSIKSYWPASSSYSSFAGIGGIFLIGAGSLLPGRRLCWWPAGGCPAFFAGGPAAGIRGRHRNRSWRTGRHDPGRSDGPGAARRTAAPGAARSTCSRPPGG